MKLVECPGCARHIRGDERACPFCNVAVPPCTCRSTETGERALSRAAVLFLGAAAVAGCKEPERAAVPPYAAAPVQPWQVEPPDDAGAPKR
jgi:hypothetical protein